MTDAAAILPTEIWCMILSNVDDFTTLSSCYSTCLLWNSFLKTTWLFPQVYPFILRELNRQDIFNCRLVTKRWRNGIDNYTQSHQKSYSPNLLKVADEQWLSTREIHNVKLSEDEVQSSCEGFISQFSPTASTRNPFVDRQLSFCSNWENTEISVNFFRLFGAHLRSLELKIQLNFPEPTITQLISHLLQLLSFLPNLKYLDIRGLLSWPEESDYDQVVQRLVESQYSTLHLSHLVYVNLPDVESSLLRSTLIKLFERVAGSEKVTILYRFMSEDHYEIVDLSWFTGVLNFFWDTSVPYWREALLHIERPIKKFSVLVRCMSSLDQLLPHILRFKKTIHMLKIDFSEIYNYHKLLSDILQTHELRGGGVKGYFSFISQFENLKLLRIVFRDNSSARQYLKHNFQKIAHILFMRHWPAYKEGHKRGWIISVCKYAEHLDLYVHLDEEQRCGNGGDKGSRSPPSYPLTKRDYWHEARFHDMCSHTECSWICKSD